MSNKECTGSTNNRGLDKRREHIDILSYSRHLHGRLVPGGGAQISDEVLFPSASRGQDCRLAPARIGCFDQYMSLWFVMRF